MGVSPSQHVPSVCGVDWVWTSFQREAELSGVLSTAVAGPGASQPGFEPSLLALGLGAGFFPWLFVPKVGW